MAVFPADHFIQTRPVCSRPWTWALTGPRPATW